MYTVTIYPKSMKKIIGPIWHLVLRRTQPTPSNKPIFKFSKRPVYIGLFETPITVSYTNRMVRVFYWIPPFLG